LDTQSSITSDHWFSSEVPTILTIDDDPLVRQSIVMYLEDCGYKVIEAANGQQGLELFRIEEPDLILCDLRMPEMDGMRLLEIVTCEKPDTPMIMISGAGMINDVVEALRLGALDYLVKPITDLQVLGHAVKQALLKKQLEKENLLFRTELEKANRELEENLAQLKEDQEAGRRAQLQLLPPPQAEINGYYFEHTVIPSLNISGDFVDYFQIDKRYFGFYIADVSGHGSASAFVTMMLKSLFNQPLRQYRINGDDTILHPDKVLNYLNKEILAANIGKHVTLFLAVVDCEANTMSYSIGGHFPRPVVVSETKKIILQERGFPVGLFDWSTYEAHEISISYPFSMFLFSDGVLECLESSGVAPESKLLTLGLDHHTQVSDIIDQLNIRKAKKLPDDVSLLILHQK
jgi:serine phosphatase RsbU (regulator of sigma subunit)